MNAKHRNDYCHIPREMFCSFFNMVSVVQLARAPDCGSGNRGFESRRIPLKRANSKNEDVD